MGSQERQPQVLSIDAGGTMTDTFIVDEQGEFTVGKAKTTPEDESVGVIESSKDALRFWNQPLEEGFEPLKSGVYSGTAMLNRLVERESEENVGIIVTKGMEDTLRMGRGRQTYIDYSYEDRLHLNTHRHDPPLVSRDWIKGVRERVDEFGQVISPVYEGDARQATKDLLAKGADTIIISTLHSYENPSHEQEIRDIARDVMAEEGESVPVLMSSEHYPRREEVPRLNTITSEAYAARPSREQLFNVEDATDEHGGTFDLRVMASHGGTIDPETEELARTLVSGPIGGIIGGIDMADKIGVDDIVCTDIGGTSFDMGVVNDNDFVIDYRPNMARLLLSLPMVDMDSVGAGTGSYVRVDPTFDRLKLGPDSAGDRVGVCNRDADVDTVTVTDCHVALGIINPDNFLGGRMDIDPDLAVEAIQDQIAEPLDMGVYEAAQSVVDILETRLSSSLESTISGTGRSPEQYTCLSYGGGGPVHTIGYTRDLGFDQVLVPAWAAAFSAYGSGVADYEYRYDRTTTLPVDADASDAEKEAVGDQLSQMWADLEDRVVDQFQPDYDRQDITFIHEFRAQYQGQLESITVESPLGRVDSSTDMEDVLEAFENTYAKIYADQARSPELGHNFTQVTVRGIVDIAKPEIPEEPEQGPEPPETARKGEREVMFDGEWHDSSIFEMDELQAGNVVRGPAIIEDPATTFAVPDGFETRLDTNRIFHITETED